MKTIHKHVRVTSNSRTQHYLRWSSLILLASPFTRIMLASLRCPLMPLAASARRHPEVVARLLRGSRNIRENSTLPAGATDSMLAEDPQLLLLGCLRRSTCSVLAESICWKDVGKVTATRPGTFHLKPISVNSNSYGQLHYSDDAPKLEPLPTETNARRRKQENLQPFLSARHILKSACFKWSHLAPWSFCHAPAGIWLQKRRSNSSSSGDWLNASNKSAAPSAPCVSLSKHLQCFVRIMSESIWRKHLGTSASAGIQSISNPSRSTPTHTTNSQIWRCFWNRTTSNGDKKGAAKNKKNFNHFSLRGTQRILPPSSWATWRRWVFATPLLGSDYSRKDPSLPAVSTGSGLQINLRLQLHLACDCRSTCSVLSESICWKDVGKARSAGIQSILNPCRSTQTHTRTSQIWRCFWNRTTSNRDKKRRCKKQEKLQPFLSARHWEKFAFFKLSHLAPLSLCHAPAGIWLQKRRSKSSSSGDWLNASNKSAAPSAPCVSLSKHLQCL